VALLHSAAASGSPYM